MFNLCYLSKLGLFYGRMRKLVNVPKDISLTLKEVFLRSIKQFFNISGKTYDTRYLNRRQWLKTPQITISKKVTLKASQIRLEKEL